MLKGMSNLKGLQNIRNMQSISKRSKPWEVSSAYLHIYILRKEEERLEKEKALLEKRKKAIQKRLDDMRGEIEVLKGSCQKEKKGKAWCGGVAEEEPGERKWKKMSLSY